MQFEDALAVVLKHEGGFVDDPDDKGGATRYGITIGTLSDWLGEKATVDQVRALTLPDVKPIYRVRYWDECRCDELPPGVALMAFDCAVNQGPATAVKVLQEAVHVDVDGILGPVTMKAVSAFKPDGILTEMAARRAVRYARLNRKFHLGWYRRLESVFAEALRESAGWGRSPGPGLEC